MKVRAKFANGKFGFYGGKRRYDGDEFFIENKSHFSQSWMEEVEDDQKPRKPRATKAPKPTPDVDSGAE